MENFADLIEATIRHYWKGTPFEFPQPTMKVVNRRSEEYRRLTKEEWTTLGEPKGEDDVERPGDLGRSEGS